MSTKALLQLYRRALLQTGKAWKGQRCFGSTTLKARWQRDEEHLQQLARERENIERMEAEQLRKLREREDSVVWLPPHAGISARHLA
jgi:hypothetical protein